jgi:hypothetical protein
VHGIDVHAEAGQVVEGMARRDGVAQRDFLEGGKGRSRHRFARVGAARLLDQPRQFGVRVVAGRGYVKTQFLAVDHVVAVAAPGIQHQDAAPGRGVEQPGRGRETLRADLDRFGRVLQQ